MNHIFYHNDPDGWCSAAIAIKHISALHPITGMAQLHECSYGMEFPWKAFTHTDTVYMLDFSLKPDEMRMLESECGCLVWCDHHVSALDAMKKEWSDYKNAVAGVQEVGKGACELTWEYFFGKDLGGPGESPVLPLPRAVKLISMYDVWKLKEEPDALPFQYGIKTVKGISDPRNQMWKELLDERGGVGGWPVMDPHTNALLEAGRLIQSYQDEINAQICKRAAFETVLVGHWSNAHYDMFKYRAIACNSPLCNSMLFDSVWDPEKHDIMLSFYWDSKGFWTVSVYSTKEDVDCSAIAKSFGGGGHHGASGFQAKKLPFKLNNRLEVR